MHTVPRLLVSSVFPRMGRLPGCPTPYSSEYSLEGGRVLLEDSEAGASREKRKQGVFYDHEPEVWRDVSSSLENSCKISNGEDHC